jgi:hypothetical protein
MAIDTSIYQNLLRPPKSVADYDQEAQASQLNQLQLQQGRQGLADQNALRQATMQFGSDTGANLQGLQKAGLYKQAQDYQKAIYDNQKTQGEIGLNKSKAGEQDSLAAMHSLDTQVKSHDFAVQKLSAVSDPSQVPQWIIENSGPGKAFTAEQGLAGYQRFQQALQQPGGFETWKQQALQGGQSATDTLKQQQALLIANNVQAGENARNAATNKTHVQTAGMAQAGENSRAALSRQTQMTIAGVAPGGGLDDNGERTAQGIASGQLQPPTGMALLNPKNQRILGRVMEINPQYDSTTVTAKKKAANDFGTGQLGNSMRSFAVAGQHLDQLNTLVDALDNKNLQIVNKVGNAYAQQTGNPAPTNFDAAKDVVSKEVVKAIVAGGGGVSEREELSKLMGNAKSPAQLKGVIQQYRNLMGAQHDALLQQRRAAGLPDSTLPSYTDANGSPGGAAPAVPAGWKIEKVQ